MQENTKKRLAAYLSTVATQNGITDATEKFNVTPAATQRIVAAIRESNWFLERINIVPVKNQIGEALGLGVTGMIASRTDTSGSGERKPKSVGNLQRMPYVCKQVNFDTSIRYETLDAWAHLPNFERVLSSHTREQINANKITIGWYGEKSEANTDAETYPNGEDVSKGWFQALREHNQERFITEGEVAGEIRLGEDGDFLNLDLAVLNVKNLLHPACENDQNLVAIIGTDLLAYDKAKFYATHGNTPTEKSKIEDRQVIGTYGGLPALSVPGFPSKGIMVTSFNNLSIYIQEDSIRRSLAKKNDAKDQVENFESMNLCYVIEQLEKCAALEFKHVKLRIGGEWL